MTGSMHFKKIMLQNEIEEKLQRFILARIYFVVMEKYGLSYPLTG